MNATRKNLIVCFLVLFAVATTLLPVALMQAGYLDRDCGDPVTIAPVKTQRGVDGVVWLEAGQSTGSGRSSGTIYLYGGTGTSFYVAPLQTCSTCARQIESKLTVYRSGGGTSFEGCSYCLAEILDGVRPLPERK